MDELYFQKEEYFVHYCLYMLCFYSFFTFSLNINRDTDAEVAAYVQQPEKTQADLAAMIKVWIKYHQDKKRKET